MSRNYGLGSRNMSVAARMGLQAAAARGDVSFSTAATVSERFSQFAQWAKENEINKMEKITSEAVTAYGAELAQRVEAGEMSPAYAQNIISAINKVMGLATRGEWEPVSPTKDCGISHRDHVSTRCARRPRSGRL